MATKPNTSEVDGMDEESTTTPDSGMETIYLMATVIFLVAAIVIMLMGAAKHFNAGIFAK